MPKAHRKARSDHTTTELNRRWEKKQMPRYPQKKPAKKLQQAKPEKKMTLIKKLICKWKGHRFEPIEFGLGLYLGAEHCNRCNEVIYKSEPDINAINRHIDVKYWHSDRSPEL